MHKLNTLLFVAILALMTPDRQLIAQDDSRTAYLDSLLHRVYLEDQAVRQFFNNINEDTDADSITAYAQAIVETDLKCQTAIFPILDSIGIPDGLSDTSYTALFLVVQHSDQEHQKRYYTLFEDGVRRGLVEPSDAATMLDRILMHDGKLQIYGTQTFSRIMTVKTMEEGSQDDGSGNVRTNMSHTYLWPVENADSLDIRRAEAGLPSIETYIGIFREMGVELVWNKEMTVEEAIYLKTNRQVITNKRQ